MGEQLQLPLGPLSSRQFEPPPGISEGAQSYAASRGLSVSHEGLDTMQASPTMQFGVQRAYRRSQASPVEAPGIRKSYEAMRSQVNDQYEHMTGAMGIKHEVTDTDPYKTPADMAADLAQGRIKTWSSAPTPHEFFTPEENDKFRAVHDVFGHAAIGRGFSRHGEEAAFHAHRQMFTPDAHAALASETRGQNSFLNYGPTGGFPDQGSKLVGVPDWASQDRLNGTQFKGGRGVFNAGGQVPRR